MGFGFLSFFSFRPTGAAAQFADAGSLLEGIW
jgi:hypothetical protein